MLQEALQRINTLESQCSAVCGLELKCDAALAAAQHAAMQVAGAQEALAQALQRDSLDSSASLERENARESDTEHEREREKRSRLLRLCVSSPRARVDEGGG